MQTPTIFNVTQGFNPRPCRVLVVIASFGHKNIHLLKQQIKAYQEMSFDIDIVVVTNDEKDLGSNVRTVVGLPSENPWSLPFAHKAIFSAEVENYDLFVYSEDDIGVTEQNFKAFLRITPELADGEVAGFLRYEVDAKQNRSYPDVFGQFHWDVRSVQRRGQHVVARFSNEHAAFYILTRSQLRQAIASGGFMTTPYEGQYDMLCTAATDPYTRCGLRKVVCVSSVEDFCVHHLSNKYAGVMGVSAEIFRKQIDALLKIDCASVEARSLLGNFPWQRVRNWALDFYGPPVRSVLSTIPEGSFSVLSIGSGWGATERALAARGAAVTALPLDSVMGALAKDENVEVIVGDINECFSWLKPRKFDYVVINNFLHLIQNPELVLHGAVDRLRPGGSLIIYGPNFNSIRVKAKKGAARFGNRRFSWFCNSNISEIGPSSVKRTLRSFGLRKFSLDWVLDPAGEAQRWRAGLLNADQWCLRAVHRLG